MLRPVPATPHAAARLGHAGYSPERLTPLVLGNWHATNTDVLEDYLAALGDNGCTPILIETQPTTADTMCAVLSGIHDYMELHDGIPPTTITAIGGDRTYADLLAAMHDARLAAYQQPIGGLSPACHALALAVAAPVPGGNGNDGARFSYGKHMGARPPMPWEWPSLRMRYPMLLSIMRPDSIVERYVVANYFGVGASAELISYIGQNRALWRSLTHAQRTRRELRLSLGYLASTRIEVTRPGIGSMSLASLDIACTNPMAKRIATESSANQKESVQEIETGARGSVAAVLMAGRLAVGMRARGNLVTNGSFIVGAEGAALYIDGDAMDRATPGTEFRYTRSEIAVPVRSLI